MSIPTLDLTGMNIDKASRAFSVLEAKFGGGYDAGVLVGHAGGLHEWDLSAGLLPDTSDYGNLISSVPRMQYYWNFFQARMAEGNGPFIIAWRAKNYHAKFVDKHIDVDVFTSDLFAGGVKIRQVRIVGQSYASDGSITP